MPRAGLTTDKVVRAGADLADEIGLEQVTLSKIARQFCVQVASLYSHVSGLGDLRTRMALLALADLADRGDAALAGLTGRDALIAFGTVHRDYATEHPGRYDAARVPLSPEVAAASAGPRLAQMMRDALADYGLAEPDETHAVRLLGSLIHGYITLERSGGFSHSKPSSEESWNRILDTLDTMLSGWH